MEKAEVLKDIEYYNNTELCISLLQKWKAKSKNPELKDFTYFFLQVLFYGTCLQQDRFIHNKIVSEFRNDKIRAVERARKADAKVLELEDQVKKLKKIINL